MTPRRIGLSIMLPLLALLAACTRAPDEAAMGRAIGAHVVAAEHYPPAFVRPDAFVFRNLQRVPGTEPAQFAVESSFDVTYTAAGPAIVAALRAESRAERDKARRRGGTFAERISGVLTGAIAHVEREQRFADVDIGDRDHYAGRFVLARNEDGSWRVVEGEYR